jgi:adenine-specific DNA-methyltransferase
VQGPTLANLHAATVIADLAPDESFVRYADRVGHEYSNGASLRNKKQFAQYFTPPPVADFMASLCDLAARDIRILDAGAGAGILTCAICDRVRRIARPHTRLTAELYETDQALADRLKSVLAAVQLRLTAEQIEFVFRVHTEDFILRNAGKLAECSGLFHADASTQFDIAMSNPPYFKLSKADPRARAANVVVHGQPNIYALFMAVSAAMLKPGGQLISITPRSFTSGRYFQAFREWFFSRVQPELVHIFDSRKKAFQRDAILQENIILKALRLENWQRAVSEKRLRISVSDGASDLGCARSHEVPISSALRPGVPSASLLLPVSAGESPVLRRRLRKDWSLKKLGLAISTGPVVAFRAKHLIADVPGNGREFAPLLWLQNVKPMRISWPLKGSAKPQYIRVDHESVKLLLPDRTYVLLRRFSAKEEARRLVAAPLCAGSLKCEYVGIENHLNYFHRAGASLTEDEAWGLAALLNGASFDRYFRALSGHTQVNAAEINEMPFPGLDEIREVGRRIRNLKDPVGGSELVIASVLSEPIGVA